MFALASSDWATFAPMSSDIRKAVATARSARSGPDATLHAPARDELPQHLSRPSLTHFLDSKPR